MFNINEDLSIYATRGDVVFFSVTADDNGTVHKFQPNDVLRMKVSTKKNCENVVLQKDVVVEAETDKVDFYLTGEDTKIGDVISKPTDFWYEIELNPLTNPQTIIGYDDETGAKIFKLFPEGADITKPIEKEDIPVVDDDFDLTSERPLQNQAITRGFLSIQANIEERERKIREDFEEIQGIAEEAKEMANKAIDTAEGAVGGDLTNYVKKTDVATQSGGYGLVKIGETSNGLLVRSSDGFLAISRANNTAIENKQNFYQPITPSTLDYAVKVGITTNTISLNHYEQQSAVNWIGALGDTIEKTVTFVCDGEDRNGKLYFSDLTNPDTPTLHEYIHTGNINSYSNVKSGTYTGTGESGKNNPCELYFDFVPHVVFIKGEYNCTGEGRILAILVNDSTACPIIALTYETVDYIEKHPSLYVLYTNWDNENKKVSYYSRLNSNEQLNFSGYTYNYFYW